jgi:hypothetical protein
MLTATHYVAKADLTRIAPLPQPNGRRFVQRQHQGTQAPRQDVDAARDVLTPVEHADSPDVRTNALALRFALKSADAIDTHAQDGSAPDLVVGLPAWFPGAESAALRLLQALHDDDASTPYVDLGHE